MKNIMRTVVLCAAFGLCVFVGCGEIQQVAEQAIAATQPPVEVRTCSHYVDIWNTSHSKSLYNVKVTYTSARGNSVSQYISVLSPWTGAILKPYDVNWRVDNHETITVTVSGYLPKTFSTNTLKHDERELVRWRGWRW